MDFDRIYGLIPTELQREITSFQYDKHYIEYTHMLDIDFITLENHCINIVQLGSGIDLIIDIYDKISEIDNVEREIDEERIDIDKFAYFNNFRPSALLYDDYTYRVGTRHKIWYEEDDEVVYPEYVSSLIDYLSTLDTKIREENKKTIDERFYMKKLKYINEIYYYIINTSDKLVMKKNQKQMAREDKK